MSNNGMPIVRGEVISVDSWWSGGTVRILDLPEHSDGLPTEVFIRSDHHNESVPGVGKYGIEFGNRTIARDPKVGDELLLRRHHYHPKLVWQWCYKEEVASPTEGDVPQFLDLRGYKRRLAKRAFRAGAAV